MSIRIGLQTLSALKSVRDQSGTKAFTDWERMADYNIPASPDTYGIAVAAYWNKDKPEAIEVVLEAY